MSEVYHADQSSFPQSESKLCRECNQEKPLDSFYLKTASKDGHAGICKSCASKYGKEHHYQKHYKHRLVQLPLFVFSKMCRKCKQELPIENFRKDKSNQDGYHEQCKKCLHERDIKWREANAERYRQRTREYREANAERINNYMKEYGREHYHLYYAANLERERARNRARAKSDPIKYTEKVRRRDAKKKSVTVGKVNYENILQRDGYHCHICGQPIDPHARKKSPESLNFDHVIPIARGGAHSEDNIKPAHKVCNQRKRNYLLEELTPRQRRGIL